MIYVSTEKIDLYILVLTALNIPHDVKAVGNGFLILIDEKNMEQACCHIMTYFKENPDEGSGEEKATTRPLHPGKEKTGLLIALLILGIHLFSEWPGDRDSLIDMYAASSRHILNGEVYRALTALFFHDGTPHLLANMAGMAFFGSIACAMAGSGIGLFSILLSGVFGNLLTAFCYTEVWHQSIGSSTAVFGAIGLITGQEFMIRKRISRNRFRAYLPLGAAISLLAFLSAGPRTDIMAHLFGLLCGIMAGVILVALEPLARGGLRVQQAALVSSILFTITAFFSPFL